MARQTDELKTGDLVKVKLTEEIAKFTEELGFRTVHNKFAVVVEDPIPLDIILQDSVRLYLFEERKFRHIPRKNIHLISKS